MCLRMSALIVTLGSDVFAWLPLNPSGIRIEILLPLPVMSTRKTRFLTFTSSSVNSWAGKPNIFTLAGGRDTVCEPGSLMRTCVNNEDVQIQTEEIVKIILQKAANVSSR